MREIITIMTGQCGNQIGTKMSEYQHYQDAPADKERVVVYTPKKWKQTRLNSSVADPFFASTFQQFIEMRLQFHSGPALLNLRGGPFSSSPNIMINQQQQQPNLLLRQITLEEAKENAGSYHDDEHSTFGVQMAMSGASMPNRDYDITPVRGGGSEDTSVKGNRDNNEEKCEVCGEPGAGNHYNAKTCGACAMFFSRAIKDKKNFDCKNFKPCSLRFGKSYCSFCRVCILFLIFYKILFSLKNVCLLEWHLTVELDSPIL
ncbi:unnamed protein product [Meloidogyne enterolobii]|uniref:Uncharacterized protein n=1 Tax=Meloidogyne enterolobii TaxID=390850 RepID=A0ACB1ANV4_MELEN